MEWHRRYVSGMRSDIDQELADFRAGIGEYFFITFDLQKSVMPVALEFEPPRRTAHLERDPIWIHPTTVGERRPILMRLKKMCSMLALALCATSAFAEHAVSYRLTPIAGNRTLRQSDAQLHCATRVGMLRT